MASEKRCTCCGETKSLDQFARHGSTRDRRQSQCKACSTIRVRQWRAEHPERARQLGREGNARARAKSAAIAAEAEAVA